YVAAMKGKMQDIMTACQSDVDKLCAGMKPGSGEIRKCLHDHMKDVSEGCKTAMHAAQEHPKTKKPPTDSPTRSNTELRRAFRGVTESARAFLSCAGLLPRKHQFGRGFRRRRLEWGITLTIRQRAEHQGTQHLCDSRIGQCHKEVTP